jgi:hypothetical protein
MDISPLVPVLIGSLLAIGCLAAAYYFYYRKRIIDDLPTSKTQGVFIGLAELKGTAESEFPLTSYLAELKCVQYSWQVEEHWRRTVTETYHDARGRTRTRTKTESGWTRVAHGGESKPFYLKDETGVIRIVPEGARIQGNVSFDKTVSPASPLYYSKCQAGAIANSTYQRRFHETAIPLHVMLYVMGQAREREDVVAAEIARDKASPMFLVSTRSEKQISRGYGRWFLFLAVLGLVIALGSGAGWAVLIRTGGDISWQPFVVMAAGYLIILVLIWVWTTYNSLINLHHRVEQGWSQVEVQLKRRHDLIPNLVLVVEAYRKHESETQMVLAELRRQMEATPSGVSGPDFKGIAPLLQVTIERYPDLKASESFLKLQQSLVDTEQRIALARDYYNDIATFFNTRLEIIPDRYAAALAGLHPRALMSAAEFERAPVRVSLATREPEFDKSAD